MPMHHILPAAGMLLHCPAEAGLRERADDDDGIAATPAISSLMPGFLHETGLPRSRRAPAPRQTPVSCTPPEPALERRSGTARAALEDTGSRAEEQKENNKEVEQNLEMLNRCGWYGPAAERASAEGA